MDFEIVSIPGEELPDARGWDVEKAISNPGLASQCRSHPTATASSLSLPHPARQKTPSRRPTTKNSSKDLRGVSRAVVRPHVDYSTRLNPRQMCRSQFYSGYKFYTSILVA